MKREANNLLARLKAQAPPWEEGPCLYLQGTELHYTSSWNVDFESFQNLQNAKQRFWQMQWGKHHRARQDIATYQRQKNNVLLAEVGYFSHLEIRKLEMRPTGEPQGTRLSKGQLPDHTFGTDKIKRPTVYRNGNEAVMGGAKAWAYHNQGQINTSSLNMHVHLRWSSCARADGLNIPPRGMSLHILGSRECRSTSHARVRARP